MDDAPERHIVGLWGGALAYPVAPVSTIVGCGALVGFNMIYEFPSFPCSQSSGLRLVIAANIGEESLRRQCTNGLRGCWAWRPLNGIVF